MIRTTTLVFLLLANIAYGQLPPPKAIIKGPTEALAGTLVFLSSEDAIGDNTVWMISEEIKASAATCGKNIFFSLPIPGTYRFGLIAANKDAAVDYIYHTIKVIPSGNSGPVDPTPVDPPPPTSFESLRVASQTGITTLNDPETAKSINAAITAALQQPPGTKLETVVVAVSTAIENALAKRSRESFRTKNWLGLWRVPVNLELDKLRLTTTESYIAAMKVVAATCK
jgi:hypothetical protein